MNIDTIQNTEIYKKWRNETIKYREDWKKEVGFYPYLTHITNYDERWMMSVLYGKYCKCEKIDEYESNKYIIIYADDNECRVAARHICKCFKEILFETVFLKLRSCSFRNKYDEFYMRLNVDEIRRKKYMRKNTKITAYLDDEKTKERMNKLPYIMCECGTMDINTKNFITHYNQCKKYILINTNGVSEKWSVVKQKRKQIDGKLLARGLTYIKENNMYCKNNFLNENDYLTEEEIKLKIINLYEIRVNEIDKQKQLFRQKKEPEYKKENATSIEYTDERKKEIATLKVVIDNYQTTL